jgi:hypothetical protein
VGAIFETSLRIGHVARRVRDAFASSRPAPLGEEIADAAGD